MLLRYVALVWFGLRCVESCACVNVGGNTVGSLYKFLSHTHIYYGHVRGRIGVDESSVYPRVCVYVYYLNDSVSLSCSLALCEIR